MASWTDALNVVEKLAPTLASVLGGPLAGAGVSALEGVFGLTPSPSATEGDRTSALAAAISGATPEQLVAMQKADQDYAVQMATLGFKDKEDIAALQVKDVQGARDMQVANKSYIVPSLAILVTVGFFGLLAAMMFSVVPAANKDILNIMVGTLGTAWVTIMSFYYGASHSSDMSNQNLVKNISNK